MVGWEKEFDRQFELHDRQTFKSFIKTNFVPREEVEEEFECTNSDHDKKLEYLGNKTFHEYVDYELKCLTSYKHD